MKKISILSFTLIFIILLSNICLAVTAADNGILKVYTTSGGLEGSYLKGFDIQGYVEGLETPISSTYSNDGYHVFLNVNGKNGLMQGELTGSDISQKLQNMHYTQVDGTQVIDGISLNVGTSFVNNGEHIKITYTLKNTTSANAKISLATAADVQIDGDDSATITRLGNGNGVLLYTLEGRYSDKPVQFAFYGKGVSGTTAIDSLWIGRWGYDYLRNIFNDNPTETKVEDRDSAFAFAWLNRDIAAGATQTYSVLMEVGEMNMSTVELTTPNNAALYTDEAIIKGIVKDSDLIDTATIHYILDNGAEKTIAPINMDGTAKNFSIDLTSLNLPVGSTHTIKVWSVDSLNTKSNEVEISFKIKEVRSPVINLITADWIGEEGKFKLTDSKNDPAKVAKYDYKIDNGAWTTVTLGTEVVAITETGTKTISARTVGVSGEVSDIVTKVIKLDKTKPVIRITSDINGAFTITGTDADSGINTVEYLWSDNGEDVGQNAVWTKYTSPVKYTGNLTGTIYLWTRVTDKAGNVTLKVQAVNSVSAPTIVAENEFVQKYAEFKLTDTANAATDVLTYQYKVNDGQWVNCNKDTIIKLTGNKENVKITARAVDIAGRKSEEVTKTVKVTIDPQVPTIVAENEFSQKYASFKIEDTVNNASNVLTYQYKVNNGDWVNCRKDTLITLTGVKGNIKITARTVDIDGEKTSAEVTKTVKVTFDENKGEKDESPRTGVTSYVGIAVFITTISLMGIIYIKRK